MKGITRLASRGFTIVELLIVIVVIGILASLVASAYAGAQDRARATAIISTIKTADKAFHMLAAEEGRTTWWPDTAFTGSANPTIATLVATTNFKRYMQSFSAPSGTSANWIYDNDGDTFAGCNATSTAGVNIYIYSVEPKLAQIIDEQLDDGDFACGSVTFTGANLRYEISPDQSFD